ncbi:grasp-with-spasm system SPASM domain peptide maturase [Tenacibaculum sp. 190524A02b]|uniref:grasp-with-spasm system SPASM domain peptide maturase n=1 Tax=Tenacibaculum vairaonense TaxID=3137860 RepID=UPI0031FAC566
MMKQSKAEHLLLFNFCKVVKGTEKSIICDFQREKIKFIPNEMGEIITMLKEKPFNSVKEYFEEDAEVFNSYINFLISEGFAFYSKDKENFIDIENYWTSPEVINNAIIEYDFKAYNLKKVLYQLDNLCTKFIEFRFTSFTEENITEFEELLKFCSRSVLRSTRIYLPYVSKEVSKKIIALTKSFPIIDCVIFYNSKSNKSLERENQQTFFITQQLKDITNSNINRKFLVNSIEYYYECQKFNPYYNKKVSIDSKGQIKNCIKNTTVFGNVKNDSLEKVVTSKSFQEFWHVTHDQITDIQNSELRYNYIITNDLEKISDGKYKLVV